jgi:hypothetical protein
MLPNALTATSNPKAYFMIRSNVELSSQRHAAAAVPRLWRYF